MALVGQLENDVEKSDAVVVARLISFQEVNQTKEKKKEVSQSFSQVGNSNVLVGPRPAGTYRFSLLALLKGQCDEHFEMTLPQIDFRAYDDINIALPEGELYLLLLRRSDDGQWTPANASLPLIPCRGNAGAAPNDFKDIGNNLTGFIIHRLLGAISDPKMGRTISFILRDTQGEEIVTVVRPLVDKSDGFMKRNLLQCLATNQVVEVIPQIGVLEGELKGQGGTVARALKSYHQVEAVPYLNALVFDTASRYTRANAVSALATFADKSSIPYLIFALHDPDRQVSYFSYVALHRMVSDLGDTKDTQYLFDHRDKEIASSDQWWMDELAGKHKDPKLVRTRPLPSPSPSTQQKPRTARGPAD